MNNKLNDKKEQTSGNGGGGLTASGGKKSLTRRNWYERDGLLRVVGKKVY